MGSPNLTPGLLDDLQIYRKGIKEQLSLHFWTHEFEDKSNQDNHYTLISPVLIDILQALRSDLDTPIQITSGYRTYLTNQEVGGEPNSYHMVGMAADFTTPNYPLDKVYEHIQAELAKKEMNEPYDFIGGFGYYPKRHFIHIDTRPVHPTVVWVMD